VFEGVAAFLFTHLNLEVLHLDVGRGAATIVLPPNALPRLRELKCGKDFANVVMSCPSEQLRPLETIKGVRLTGQNWDHSFLQNLKRYPVKRLELTGFNEFEDIKRLVDCIPKVAWLDVGKKANSAQHKPGPGVVSGVVDWADLLTQLPDLSVFHGVRFFYEVAEGAAQSSFAAASISDRSRVKKNEEVASVLAWKCPKLRRLDHWDEGAGKVIVLLKEDDKVKWEVRRVKQ